MKFALRLYHVARELWWACGISIAIAILAMAAGHLPFSVRFSGPPMLSAWYQIIPLTIGGYIALGALIVWLSSAISRNSTS